MITDDLEDAVTFIMEGVDVIAQNGDIEAVTGLGNLTRNFPQKNHC